MGYRASQWRVIDRRRAAYRSKMRPLFREALEKQIAPLLEVIPRYTDITQVEVPVLSDEGIRAAYKRLYLSAAFDFARADRLAAKSLRGGMVVKSEEEIFESLMQERILSYMDRNLGTTITAIGDTSKDLLQGILRQIASEIVEQGLGGGAAQTMLRDRIESEWHRAAYYRTERIVRTEVNRASNWGSLEGVKSSDIPHNKVWLSAFAPQSRSDHMEANGQVVDTGEDFSVGPDMLSYPGDPRGEPGNTINCMCSLTYEVKK